MSDPKCRTTHYACDCVLGQLQAADESLRAADALAKAARRYHDYNDGSRLYKALEKYEKARGK